MTQTSANDLSYLLEQLAVHSKQSLSDLGKASNQQLVTLLNDLQITEPPLRWQDKIIVEHLRNAHNVLDLGCGSGDLLLALAAQGIRGQGVELEYEAVLTCVQRGVSVIHTDLGLGLKSFPDNSVDAVVCEQTLQTLTRPIALLEEMLRVGRLAIASFPNFGYWRIRLDLALRGRMPSSHGLPHHWYDTPNIHLFTIADFHDWIQQHGYRIDAAWVLVDGQVRPYAEGDNLLAEEALFVIESLTDNLPPK